VDDPLWVGAEAALQAKQITFGGCTLVKKKKNFPHIQYKEIQKGAVAKSYMRKGFLIYEEMRKYLIIYDFATALLPNFLIYMNKIFFFISALYHRTTTKNLFNTSVHF
jgi:hypothetical protein